MVLALCLLLSTQHSLLLSTRHSLLPNVPDADVAVAAAGGQRGAVGGEPHDVERAPAVVGERLPAAVHVPHLHEPVGARAGDPLAVAAEADRVDVVGVRRDRPQEFAVARVPDADGA